MATQRAFAVGILTGLLPVFLVNCWWWLTTGVAMAAPLALVGLVMQLVAVVLFVHSWACQP